MCQQLKWCYLIVVQVLLSLIEYYVIVCVLLCNQYVSGAIYDVLAYRDILVAGTCPDRVSNPSHIPSPLPSGQPGGDIRTAISEII